MSLDTTADTTGTAHASPVDGDAPTDLPPSDAGRPDGGRDTARTLDGAAVHAHVGTDLTACDVVAIPPGSRGPWKRPDVL